MFDKVRENTEHVAASTKRTFAEAANLAVNQTLVRSINTSVVALLPVGAILFIGAGLLGAGTSRTYRWPSSSASRRHLLLDLHRDAAVRRAPDADPEMKAQEQRVLKPRREERAAAAEPVLAA